MTTTTYHFPKILAAPVITSGQPARTAFPGNGEGRTASACAQGRVMGPGGWAP